MEKSNKSLYRMWSDLRSWQRDTLFMITATGIACFFITVVWEMLVHADEWTLPFAITFAISIVVGCSLLYFMNKRLKNTKIEQKERDMQEQSRRKQIIAGALVYYINLHKSSSIIALESPTHPDDLAPRISISQIVGVSVFSVELKKAQPEQEVSDYLLSTLAQDINRYIPIFLKRQGYVFEECAPGIGPLAVSLCENFARTISLQLIYIQDQKSYDFFINRNRNKRFSDGLVEAMMESGEHCDW